MVNVPMDVSRESQRSTNISEVEESAEVRNTMGYFAFLISFYIFSELIEESPSINSDLLPFLERLFDIV